MAIRGLSLSERTLAYGVFLGSIIYSNVRVQDDLGLGGRPWTSPPTLVYNRYILHVGPDLYPNLAAGGGAQRLLIHELAHVWQGQHGVPMGYVLNSAFHQSIAAITNGGDVAPAYSYSSGLKWRQYNCEQQASIVEDWYGAGAQATSALYTYIQNNVRPGNPWA
jgi:hypothetical protein